MLFEHLNYFVFINNFYLNTNSKTWEFLTYVFIRKIVMAFSGRAQEILLLLVWLVWSLCVHFIIVVENMHYLNNHQQLLYHSLAADVTGKENNEGYVNKVYNLKKNQNGVCSERRQTRLILCFFFCFLVSFMFKSLHCLISLSRPHLFFMLSFRRLAAVCVL